jgi:hypothetical protein
MDSRKLVDAAIHSGGVIATARWQGHAEQLEKPSSPQGRNLGKKVDPITVNSGKWIEGERVADGSAVAMNWSNVRGAKGPCGQQSSDKMGRQGRDEKSAHWFAGPEKEDLSKGEV